MAQSMLSVLSLGLVNKVLIPKPGLLDKYDVVVGNLWRFEMTSSGYERLMLGFVAAGIAGFILRHQWTDEADQRAAAALAERAREIGRKCHATRVPIGQT